jgi:ferredoxin
MVKGDALMSKRSVVKIDADRCNGCGQCVTACAEGAIEIVGGKARLVSESYCDGLGACLGSCPQDAITVEEREAPEFDEEAVRRHLAGKPEAEADPEPLPCGCPGTAMRSLGAGGGCPGSAVASRPAKNAPPPAGPGGGSQLGHWPVQLRLVPPGAAFLKGADLLIAADCSAYALADIHRRYLSGRAVLVGCPKLDDLEFYRGKLKDIFREARPASITVLRMAVPCCAGIASVAQQARDQVAPGVPLEIHTIAIAGDGIAVELAG